MPLVTPDGEVPWATQRSNPGGLRLGVNTLQNVSEALGRHEFAEEETMSSKEERT